MRLAHQTRKSAPARPAERLLVLAAAILLSVLSLHVGHAQERSSAVQRVKTIGFTVGDIDREASFFANVLGFEKIANMRIVQLKLGEQVIELTQYVSPPTGRNIPVWSNSNDAWFQHMAIVVGDMDAAYKILQDNNVRQISSHPITIPASNPGAAGVKAIKFHDPERHPLELIFFPPGKGDPSWQKPSDKLFRGIDHTAMTVPSTDKGVTFYRDLLGFNVGVTTLNSGTTQDVLDGLLNDTCLVTSMMPPSAPPHVEFLEYKTPPGGRLMPAESKANDLWNWQATLVSKNIQALAGRLRQAGAQFISSSVVAIPEAAQSKFGFKKALMIRDTNGHALRLVEE